MPAPYSGTTTKTLETSREAAELIEPKAGSLRALILDHLREHPKGLTDSELQEQLNIAGNTERPRRRELEAAGRIQAIDFRKINGRQCVVWAVK